MSRQEFLDDLYKVTNRPILPLAGGAYFSTDGYGGYTACPIGNLLLRLGFVTRDQLKEGGYKQIDMSLRYVYQKNSIIRQLAKHYGIRTPTIDSFILKYDLKSKDISFDKKRNGQLKKLAKAIIEKMRK